MKNNAFLFSCLTVLVGCFSNEPVSPQAQLKIDTLAIKAYLSQNNLLPPTTTRVKPAVWYVIDNLKNGVYPIIYDSVTLSYQAYVIQNATTLTPINVAPPTTFLLSQAMAGLQQGL